VLVGQHVFGVTPLDQAAPDKGAQDAPAQICLPLRYDCRIDSAGRVEDDARRGGLGIGIGVGIAIGISIAWHFLTMRRVLHEGQTPRPLQEKATK
jgi:hypothetical protein